MTAKIDTFLSLIASRLELPAITVHKGKLYGAPVALNKVLGSLPATITEREAAAFMNAIIGGSLDGTYRPSSPVKMPETPEVEKPKAPKKLPPQSVVVLPQQGDINLLKKISRSQFWKLIQEVFGGHDDLKDGAVVYLTTGQNSQFSALKSGIILGGLLLSREISKDLPNIRRHIIIPIQIRKRQLYVLMSQVRGMGSYYLLDALLFQTKWGLRDDLTRIRNQPTHDGKTIIEKILKAR